VPYGSIIKCCAISSAGPGRHFLRAVDHSF
jgi:hypothetical protein